MTTLTLPASIGHVVRHSRAQMAVKAALAASLSWVVAELLAAAGAGLVDLQSYIYYAPLGAVVASSSTVASAARAARSTLLALLLGAGLGVLVHATLERGLLSLAVAVGVGVALGSLPGLDDQRSWVPIVALFVLIIGDDHAGSYAVAYVVLVAVGAACGVLVNLLMPALHLTEADQAIDRLRSLLAEQLRECAGALRQLPLPSRAEWEERMSDPVLEADRSRQAVLQVRDASRGNPRRRHHAGHMNEQEEVRRTLERIAVLVEDLPETIADAYASPGGPLDEDVAEVLATALEHLAELVCAYGTRLPVDDPRVEDAEESVQQLTAAFGRRRDLGDADVAVLGAVVANLRRAVTTIAPTRTRT